jgi:hypothetical protein
MSPDAHHPTDKLDRRRRRVHAAAWMTGGVVAGAVLAGALGASASTLTSTTLTAAGLPSGRSVAPHGPGGSAPVRGDEKAVTTAQATTLKAAALRAVPGGSVYRIETDAGDGAYEVHMTKADGSLATVKFDKALTLIKVESGMGTGDPAPAAGPGHNPGTGPGRPVPGAAAAGSPGPGNGAAPGAQPSVNG